MRAVTLNHFLQDAAALIASADTEPVVLVREDAQNLILLPEEDWRGLQETLYLLQSQENAKRIRKGIHQTLEHYRSDADTK